MYWIPPDFRTPVRVPEPSCIPVTPRRHLAHLLPLRSAAGPYLSFAESPRPHLPTLWSFIPKPPPRDLLTSYPNLPPSSSSRPTPVPGPPLLPIQSQFPGTRPRPESIPRWVQAFPPSPLVPTRSAWRPENGLDQAWHSPRRSGAEQARRTRPGGGAGSSLQAPSGAAAILLCCAGCRGAVRAAWAEPAAVTPLPGAWGRDQASRRSVCQARGRAKARGSPREARFPAAGGERPRSFL